MTENVVAITSAHRGAYLGAANFYRMPDGQIAVMVLDMADHMIESRESVPERFELFAEWLRAGAEDLVSQGKEFVEPEDDFHA